MVLGEQSDPTAEFRFGVELEGLVVGWFTECGGLTIERTVFPHEEGGVNEYVHQLPGQITHTNITLKRGISDQSLWEWFRQGLYDGRVTRHNVSIVLYGVDFSQVRRWSLTNAYPVKWTGPMLESGNSQVTVESIEIAQGVGGSGSASGESVGLVQRAANGESSEHTEAGSTTGIDVDALAKKVYDLLRYELGRERERTVGRRS
ncbi:MAG: phage tail protein [Anaerolineae bacterium]|nr:phage tail protein [Anaerolineae bacterium]